MTSQQVGLFFYLSQLTCLKISSDETQYCNMLVDATGTLWKTYDPGLLHWGRGHVFLSQVFYLIFLSFRAHRQTDRPDPDIDQKSNFVRP